MLELCLVMTLMAQKFAHSTPCGRCLPASSHTLNVQFSSKFRTKEGNSIGVPPTALTIHKTIWTYRNYSLLLTPCFDIYSADSMIITLNFNDHISNT